MQALAERLAAARTGAAVGPVTNRGLVRIHGRDRQSFVHRMCTQKVAGLSPGAATHVAFLDVKAHVVAEGTLLVRTDDLLLVVEPSAAEAVRTHLARYVIMDHVKLEDVSAGSRVVPALGPRGVELARSLATPGQEVWEDALRGVPAVMAVLADEEAPGFRDRMIAAGAVALEEGDLEILRVMAGVPRYGADVDASRLAMEAGLLRTAVSFDKGCYLGQEVVLRGTFRGQVQKGLVQLELPPGAAPGAALSSAGNDVGVVTSAVDTPEGRLGLGYLRRAHWNLGERLATSGGDAVVRRVLVEER